jgi:hypothetical protein
MLVVPPGHLSQGPLHFEVPVQIDEHFQGFLEQSSLCSIWFSFIWNEQRFVMSSNSEVQCSSKDALSPQRVQSMSDGST